MKFIRKKNLQENEELLYVPRLHWFFSVKHMVLFVPVFIILLVMWRYADTTYDNLEWLSGLSDIQDVKYYIRNVFLALLILAMLVFVWRVFQYICSEYGVTNKRVILKQGVLRTVMVEIPIDRIESIRCTKNLLGMFFNYGTLCISGIGGTTQVFRMISRPYALRRRIVRIIEKNKAITVVHGEFPRLKPVEVKIEEEPIHRYGTFVRVLDG
jgi:membrane protein YdbS with pleckstrin-like domain